MRLNDPEQLPASMLSFILAAYPPILAGGCPLVHLPMMTGKFF
jgi:hypothetical protein